MKIVYNNETPHYRSGEDHYPVVKCDKHQVCFGLFPQYSVSIDKNNVNWQECFRDDKRKRAGASPPIPSDRKKSDGEKQSWDKKPQQGTIAPSRISSDKI